MNKKIILSIFITLIIAALLVIFIPEMASSQPPPPPSKPAQTPIDGGLGLLAAAGGAYAIKKLRDRKRENLG